MFDDRLKVDKDITPNKSLFLTTPPLTDSEKTSIEYDAIDPSLNKLIEYQNVKI